jgi:hypothetical protein
MKKEALNPSETSITIYQTTWHYIFVQVSERVGVYLFLEVLGSNLSRDTCYPERCPSWFFSVSIGKYRDIISISPRSLPSKYFPIHHSPIILEFDTAQSSYWQDGKIAQEIFEPRTSGLSRVVAVRTWIPYVRRPNQIFTPGNLTLCHIVTPWNITSQCTRHPSHLCQSVKCAVL